MLPSIPVGVAAGGALLHATSVLLQSGQFQQYNQYQEIDPMTSAIGSFVLTLVVGAILLAVAPGYVERLGEDINAEPLANFGWGILVLIGVIVVSVVLFITVVGAILAIPLLLAFVIAAIVGQVLAYIAVLGRWVDDEWQALGAGAVVAGALNLIPGIGGLIGFVIGSIGIGAIVRDWRS